MLRKAVALHTTQDQLIQKKKLASPGELTAGIAHEIQNPLKFTNNFPEVRPKLMNRLKVAQEADDAEKVRVLGAERAAAP